MLHAERATQRPGQDTDPHQAGRQLCEHRLDEVAAAQDALLECVAVDEERCPDRADARCAELCPGTCAHHRDVRTAFQNVLDQGRFVVGPFVLGRDGSELETPIRQP